MDLRRGLVEQDESWAEDADSFHRSNHACLLSISTLAHAALIAASGLHVERDPCMDACPSTLNIKLF